MKLWVDDKRLPPDDTWQLATDAETALHYLRLYHVQEISLDNDLGPESPEGYLIADYIENRAFEDPNYTPPEVMRCHSANPVARRRMETVFRRINALKRST